MSRLSKHLSAIQFISTMARMESIQSATVRGELNAVMYTNLPHVMAVFLILAASHRVTADEPAPHSIKFERQVLEFAPTRSDLTIGIVRFSVLSPDKDWNVKLEKDAKDNFDDRGEIKNLELKQVGKNRFELPALTIEPAGEKSGAVCMSVKIWFNELPNERLFFFVDLADRYSQLSYCTRNVPEAQHHFSQNRVATLDEFRERLKKPFVLNLKEDCVAWRPGIVVDYQGGVYFQSLIVGRSAVTWGFTHHTGIWKFTNGKLEQLPIPNLTTDRRWLELVHNLPKDRYGTLITAGLTKSVACDRKGNLYFELITQENLDAPQYRQVAKIDTMGARHIVAGSVRGHKDGPADQAQFSNITALAAGPAGEMYVADAVPDSGSWIRRVAADGTVTTLAGSHKLGSADGNGNAARFYLPSALAADRSGNVYVADPLQSRIRKVTPDGHVTTVVGGNAAGTKENGSFVQPSGVAVGPRGDLYVLDGGQKLARVRRISQNGKAETLVVIDGESETKGSVTK